MSWVGPGRPGHFFVSYRGRNPARVPRAGTPFYFAWGCFRDFGSGLALGPLLPDHREMDDGLHGFFHVLHAHPFLPRMEGVLAGKNVGAGQPHERQPRAVGAAADRTSDRFQSGAADRLDGVVDDLGVAVDHLLHVAVLRLDLEPPA